MKAREKRVENQVNRTAIMVCGILMGISLIAFGVHYNMNSEFSRLNLPTLEKLQSEINVVYQENSDLRKKMLEEYEKNGQSLEYEKMNRELQEKESNRANLEERLLKMRNHDYDGAKGLTMGRSMPFFVGGIMIIMASLMVSGVLFSLQKNRAKM